MDVNGNDNTPEWGYWVAEVELGCTVSLERLERICAAAGYSYQATVEALKGRINGLR